MSGYICDCCGEDYSDLDFQSDDAFQAAVHELRQGRFEEVIHHLDRACDGQLSGLAYLFEQEKSKLSKAGGQ